MLPIVRPQGNAKENNRRHHCTPFRRAAIQNTDHTGAGEDVERQDSGHRRGNAQWHNHFKRQFGNFLKTKPTFTIWSSNHTPQFYSNEWKRHSLHMDVHSSFLHYRHSWKHQFVLSRWWIIDSGPSRQQHVFQDWEEMRYQDRESWRKFKSTDYVKEANLKSLYDFNDMKVLKDKTMETVKTSDVFKGFRGKEWAQKIVWKMKLLYMTAVWMQVIDQNP